MSGRETEGDVGAEEIQKEGRKRSKEGGMNERGTRRFLGDDRGSCWASLQPQQLPFFFSFFLLFLSNSF